jgi:hypothetical protein
MPRLIGGLAAALLAVVAVLPAQGPVPGQNINMVSGTEFPGGDPWLQKQNEPSIAVSTRNPCHLLGGANDYRAVEVPGLPDDMEIGDAWLGIFKSIDCGQTWFSTLMPGYLQDTSPEGDASPVKGLTTGADPVVRPGTGGLFFYSFIAFNRGSNVGKLAVARFVDHNNKEAGDPIEYLDTTVWDNGSAGQFLDKPWMAVSPNAGSCTIDGQTYPGNTVHVAWSVFVGNSDQNIRTKLYYARSSNCGASLDGPPTKLSESYAINQGATLAVSPDGQTVYAVWRQFASDKDPNRVLITRSNDGGRSFPKAWAVDVLSSFVPFDQGTTAVSFRTNAYPTAAVDHTGRLHVAIQARFGLSNQSRILVTSSLDGQTWEMPRAVETGVSEDAHLHQIMPSMTYAGGRLHLIWYDLRDTAVRLYKNAYDPTLQPVTDFIAEINPVRQTLDVRGARGTIPTTGGAAGWETYGLLQGVPESTAPKLSQYLIGAYSGSSGLRQLQFNMPNLKLYAGGTRPFMGDYIDIAGLAYVPTATGWELNTGSHGGVPTTAAQTVHAVWTDNRDAKVGGGNADLGYVPPGASCDPATQAHLTTTRNANVYTAQVTPALVVAAPGNAKPTVGPDGIIERAFAVTAHNRTAQLRHFQLTIANQPADGGSASFQQFFNPADGPLTQILASIPPKSSIARTVYVNSTDRYAQIRVEVVEVVSGGDEPLSGATILNPDIQNPDIQNPDIQNPDIQNPDIQNTEIHNPDIQNPDIQNPDIQNPDIQNPDIQNPDIQNPDIQNPDIQNPDIQNPDIQNPDIQNPDIQNPDIQNGSITDVSFDVTNEGNTTSSYQVKFEVDGDTDPFIFQMIGRRVYLTPTADGCDLVLAGQNQILFNINNPDLTPGSLADANDGDFRNATVLIRPGETIKVTLRAWDKDAVFGAGTDDGNKATPFCPRLGGLCDTLTHRVTATVAAQAANTGETEPAVATTTAAVDQLAMGVIFLQQPPASVPANSPFNVTVRVQDQEGAPLPGVTVRLELDDNPGDASLVPANPTAVTNVDAVATFANISVTSPGAGYTLRAVAEFVGYPVAYGISDPFTVTAAFVVTTTADAGAGSLRQVILDANAAPGQQTIAFDLPGDDFVIAPLSPLPQIIDPVVIDGTTQPGYAGTPLIQIDGAGAGQAPGLAITAGSSTVRGLSIGNFGGAGIALLEVGGNTLQANYIGVRPDGAAAPNAAGVVLSGSPNNLIGDTLATARNVIAGNTGDGITILGGLDFGGTAIVGNYIGTNPAGTAAVPNGQHGIRVQAPSQIGGTAAGAGNVISGNALTGIQISGDDHASTVEGNLIGTNAAGTAAIPNGAHGIEINDTEFSVIGGTVPSARNVISGNGGFGIWLGGDASVTTIQGNHIGTNAAGTAAIGNVSGGVHVTQTFSTQLGGTATGARNIISGNGVGVSLADASNNDVVGNYVGLDVTGTVAIPNASQGIVIGGESQNNRVGGSLAGAGNVISGNAFAGVLLQGEGNNPVRGNYIGTNAAGTAAVPNGTQGVVIAEAGAVIGGTAPGEGNVISGNTFEGVATASSGTGAVIQGNRIGTNAAGTAAVPNGTAGVLLLTAGNTVGGAFAAARNVLSGNGQCGVSIQGEGATGNIVRANYIGMNADGNAALPNVTCGVHVFNAAANTIGGPTAGDSNLIAGNLASGVNLAGEGTQGNVVRGNRIGLPDVGNGNAGVLIEFGASANVVGGNPADGTAPNLIGGNGGDGIRITGGTGNLLRHNRIDDNALLGIDLGGNGVTANDPGDGDAGPNDYQNFPELTSATMNDGLVQIQGSLNSTPITVFDIDFLVSNACDVSGHGEGAQWVASGQFLSDGGGNIAFNIGFQGVPVSAGQFITALATSPANNTSEFSNCQEVIVP